MKNTIAGIINKLTFNQVRFNYTGSGQVQSLRWFWTPITNRFAHGGWVYVSLSWLWRFRSGLRHA